MVVKCIQLHTVSQFLKFAPQHPHGMVPGDAPTDYEDLVMPALLPDVLSRTYEVEELVRKVVAVLIHNCNITQRVANEQPVHAVTHRPEFSAIGGRDAATRTVRPGHTLGHIGAEFRPVDAEIDRLGIVDLVDVRGHRVNQEALALFTIYMWRIANRYDDARMAAHRVARTAV